MEGKGNMDRISDKNPCSTCTADRQIGNPYRHQCECDRCLKPDRWKDECLKKLSEYEGLEKQGKLLKLPCAVGDTVYVLTECESIPEQLDGTLWDENGAHGTATGYYCPYENSCPFDDEDFEDCEKYKAKTAVFEDTVASITVDESGVWITTQNCMVNSQIGLYVFLTKELAEVALKEMSE